MKNIYVIYGENKEAVNDYEKKIAKNYLKILDEFNYIKINMNENTIESLIYECRSSGLFGNEKVVIAENCNFLLSRPKKIKIEHNIDVLEKYLENINDDVVLILKSSEKIDNRKKIVKILKTQGELKEFSNFNERELVDFIVKEVKNYNIKITKENAQFLVNYTRFDFSNIKRELEKLILYCESKGSIKKEDIELLSTRSLEYDVFALTNELFNKNYDKLREVYSALVLNKEDSTFLLLLIAGQLRIYYKVKTLLNEQYSQKEIAKNLGLHPYRVQLAVQGVVHYDIEKIMKTLVLAAEYDKMLKTSYIDKYLILDLFINKLIEEFKISTN
ncbi:MULTISPECIES: DNA polymerase III subunit delta [Gemella]|uniref:DNA polymerase III subunit delta n=1 Tax=Gemella TaxID=1378 RepID=UPI000767FFFB|nr:MULTISPECIES: DNA polymerase III subunit delta [Gemella]AME09497.1 DNA polymerase III subunit delta [Gemella sp. oral taxon 928]AXI27137.1 DNA polymerase III subunit delta [Gemella sp. ND 6198]